MRSIRIVATVIGLVALLAARATGAEERSLGTRLVDQMNALYNRRVSHEQAAIGLQRDPDLAAGRNQTIQQLDQSAEPGKIITDPLLGQHPTRRVNHRDVVVLLGPVKSAVNLHRLYVPSREMMNRYGAVRRPNGKRSTAQHPNQP